MVAGKPRIVVSSGFDGGYQLRHKKHPIENDIPSRSISFGLTEEDVERIMVKVSIILKMMCKQGVARRKIGTSKNLGSVDRCIVN